MTEEQQNQLRLIPAVDTLLRSGVARANVDEIGAAKLASMARDVTGRLRIEIVQTPGSQTNGFDADSMLVRAETLLAGVIEAERRQMIRTVINATGVILHTNLGRSPLSEGASEAAAMAGSWYCNLEYDVSSGERSRRGLEIEELLCELTGAEGALVVNNCAAATLLVLSVIGSGGEAIISRGELVEIGGDFRVPDVMAMSGTRLVEVGTTNRTRLSDYSSAISPDTRLVMRVHPSNYRIIGFTAAPKRSELIKLAHDSELPIFEDAGSGALVDLSEFGIKDEPVIPALVKEGVDLVSFSGDKLLGGPQAGIIVGTERYVKLLRKSPLFRALRPGKLVLSTLAATLRSYRRNRAFDDIPILKSLSMPVAEIEQRSRRIVEGLSASNSELECLIRPGFSVVGGGSAPGAELLSCQIVVAHPTLSADAIDDVLRSAEPPVIARIVDGKVALDLRTVPSTEDELILAVLNAIGK